MQFPAGNPLDPSRYKFQFSADITGFRSKNSLLIYDTLSKFRSKLLRNPPPPIHSGKFLPVVNKQPLIMKHHGFFSQNCLSPFAWKWFLLPAWWSLIKYFDTPRSGKLFSPDESCFSNTIDTFICRISRESSVGILKVLAWRHGISIFNVSAKYNLFSFV